MPEENMKPICVYVPNKAKILKNKLGITWRGLILRGLESTMNKDEESITSMKEKIAKMSTKMQSLSMKCYELEQKQEK